MTTMSLHRVPRPTKKHPKRKAWVRRWFSENRKKRYSVTIGDCRQYTQRQAEAIMRKAEGAINNNLKPIDRPARMMFVQFAKADRTAIASDVRRTTLGEHDTAVGHATEVWGDTLQLNRVTRSAVGLLKSYLKDDREQADATVAKILRTLRALFNRAIGENLITDNPFKGQIQSKVFVRPARHFKKPEIQAMLDVSPDDWWTGLLLVYFTSGFRLNEAMNLTWDDTDLDGGTLTINPKRSGSFAIDGVTYPIMTWAEKSHKSGMVSPIPPETVEALQRLKLKSNGNRYVFVPLDRLRLYLERRDAGTLPNRFDLIPHLLDKFKAVQRYAQAHLSKGKDKPVEWKIGTLHDCRKTFSGFVIRGQSAAMAQKLLGHTSLAVTLNHYHGVTEEDGQETRELFADFKGKSDPGMTLTFSEAG